MAKTLVLAEKPSVGKDIARVLKCHQTHQGYIEGSKYIVTWALGHLITLADPEIYEKRYQSWNITDLPIIPEQFKFITIKQTAKQFQTVKTQMLRNDVNEIVIATDAGREGEMVAREIIYKLNIKKPLKRLWISSITDQAILNGFKNLKDAKEYYPLYLSALSRAKADWLVGINATRALTCKYNANLSCGRVQTPTLALIAKREDEIKNFKPEPIYSLQVKINDEIFTYHTQTKQTFIKDYAFIHQLSLKVTSLKIKEIKSTRQKSYAPLLYDLTELQKDANLIYGYSAKETLNYMQSLYEYHKVLTYPRTDSRYLTTDIIPTLKERLNASLGGDYDSIIQTINLKNITPKSYFINNQKVTDHHAIIPTEQPAYIASMNEGERRIYTLVLKRFLAVLMPPHIFIKTNIIALFNEHQFIASGKSIEQMGFKAIMQNDSGDDEDILLARYQQGQTFTVEETKIVENYTKAPSHFTEGTLLLAMENPSQYDHSLKNSSKEILTKTGGLGTVATRADIIEKLFQSFYIEKNGQAIQITHKGRQLLNLVPEELKSPQMTANLELQLQKIATNKLNPKHFMNDIQNYTQQIIHEITSSQLKFKHDNLTHKKCPECGAFLLEVNGKKGKMLVCSQPDCKYKERLSIITNARCPNCHKKLELVGKGDKQKFVCKTCGYKEMLSAFKKRSEQAKISAAKSDVKKYLKQQEKQKNNSLDDNPFASLLQLKDNLK